MAKQRLIPVTYLSAGHFLSATFENWESEFLQMTVYAVMTALLVQKGSPESRNTDDLPEEQSARSPSMGGLERMGCGFGCMLTR